MLVTLDTLNDHNKYIVEHVENIVIQPPGKKYMQTDKRTCCNFVCLYSYCSDLLGGIEWKKNGTINLMKNSIPFRQLNSWEKYFVQILFQTKSSSRSINVDDSSD